MRRYLGVALTFLGAFVLVASAIAWVWLPGQLTLTSLDAAVRHQLTGDAETTSSSGSVPVRMTTVATVVSQRSSGDVASWQSSSCVVTTVDPDTPDCLSSADSGGRLVAAGLDDFATDRSSGLAVNDPDLLPADAVPHDGLVVDWPADARRTTYPYWFAPVGAAVEAAYDRTEDVDGLETYVYLSQLDQVPMTPDAASAGSLTGEVEVWVEPTTGSVVRLREDYARTGGPDGEPRRLTVTSTDDDASRHVADARDERARIDLLSRTLPTIGFAVGGVLLVVAIAMLVVGGRRSRRREPEPERGRRRATEVSRRR